MKKTMLNLLVCAFALGMATTAGATEPVASNDLPAALLALGGDSFDLLTTSEADDVRGEGLRIGAKANVRVKARADANVKVLNVAHVKTKAKVDVKVKARARLGVGGH